MTSPQGRCHTFDRRADGYARGEACGTIAIRNSGFSRLEIKGSTVRHDGRSASLTAPNGEAQIQLLTTDLLLRHVDETS